MQAVLVGVKRPGKGKQNLTELRRERELLVAARARDDMTLRRVNELATEMSYTKMADVRADVMDLADRMTSALQGSWAFSPTRLGEIVYEKTDRKLVRRTRMALYWLIATSKGPWYLAFNGTLYGLDVRTDPGGSQQVWVWDEDEERKYREVEEGQGGVGVDEINVDSMERLFATDSVVMMEGLGTRIGFEEGVESWRMRQVYTTFEPYARGKELPPGTTAEVMRFLVVSAGVRDLWKRLDELDPRLADALIWCYGEGMGMTALAELLPAVNNPAMASYLVTRGLKKLYEWLPEKSDLFPLDKSVEFPLEEMLSTRRTRQRAAGEKRAEVSRSSDWGRRMVGRRWWPTAEDDAGME